MIPKTINPTKPDPNKFGKQAYTASHDPRFWEFAKAANLDEAAKFINDKCGTKALRFIDDTPEAIAKWQVLSALSMDRR